MVFFLCLKEAMVAIAFGVLVLPGSPSFMAGMSRLAINDEQPFVDHRDLRDTAGRETSGILSLQRDTF